MKPGKLETDELEKIVFPHYGTKRSETILRSGIGEDSCALDMGDHLCVMSTDPITGASKDGGWLSIHASCNDIASSGAEPVAILITVLLKENSSEDDIKEIMLSAEKAAKEAGVEIIGGHTEITKGLKQNIISVTAIGKAKHGALSSADKAEEGDMLVLTKGAGIEGTAILLNDYEEYFKSHLDEGLISSGQRFMKEISIIPEARIALKLGAKAMHDVTEGGILGASYEMAVASGLGVAVEKDKIPVREQTRCICDKLDIDPLKLISSGSLLIAIEDGHQLVEKLREAGIDSAVIGTFTGDNKKVLCSSGTETEILPPASDELWKAKELLDR